MTGILHDYDTSSWIITSLNNFVTSYLFLQEGLVYAVEFSHRSGRDLLNVAKKRTNIIPIIEDARHPHKYRMLVSMVDCIFADVAQPDQARIVAINAHNFLKNGGHFVISIKVISVQMCTINSVTKYYSVVRVLKSYSFLEL